MTRSFLLVISGRDFEQILSVLKNKMQNGNIIKLNTYNTKAIVFRGKRANTFQNDITIENNQVNLVQNFKYWRDYLDNKLKFKTHTDYVTKKLAQKAGILRRINDDIDRESALRLYDVVGCDVM